MTAIGLGWRVHGSSAVLVAVTGPAESAGVVHREVVTLVDGGSRREPYHAATAVALDDVPALIESAREEATTAAVAAIRALVSSVGPVAAIGVVGGNRALPDLPRILAKHALLHAAERDLFERAIMDAATRAGLPITAVPATGKLLDHASELLGVDVGASLARAGKSIGPPWQKEHREAAAAALVALHEMGADETG
ncbi:MAG TPA: hypothetical protein VHD87_11160 [Acidimicrobiales bacterium]|nr:hypothetical protein [Acidimicrobiales bacterium]